jgi:hypothetical protein
MPVALATLATRASTSTLPRRDSTLCMDVLFGVAKGEGGGGQLVRVCLARREATSGPPYLCSRVWHAPMTRWHHPAPHSRAGAPAGRCHLWCPRRLLCDSLLLRAVVRLVWCSCPACVGATAPLSGGACGGPLRCCIKHTLAAQLPSPPPLPPPARLPRCICHCRWACCPGKKAKSHKKAKKHEAHGDEESGHRVVRVVSLDKDHADAPEEPTGGPPTRGECCEDASCGGCPCSPRPGRVC